MAIQASAIQWHRISDANLTVTTALPAAGATGTSAQIDLGDNTDSFFPEGVSIELTLPATPALAASETITFTVLADTGTTASTALSPSLTAVVTGTAGTGAAAQKFNWRIPGNIARYLAVKATLSANAGNNTAVSFTTKLVGAGTPA